MKFFSIFFALFCFLLFSNFQCGKEFPCDPSENEASISTSITPEKKEYLIGDTIFLSASFGTMLPLTNSNETIATEHGACILGIYIMKLGDAPDDLTGFYNFDIINISGDLNQNDMWDEIVKRYKGFINFNCGIDTCGFKIGLVPKVTGDYCFSLNIGNVVTQDTSMCPEWVKFDNNVFNVSSHNREIFQELGIKYSIRLPTSSTSGCLDIIESDGAYAFKVK